MLVIVKLHIYIVGVELLLIPVAVRFTQLLSGQHEFPSIGFFRIRMGRGSMLTHPQYMRHEYTFPCSPDDQLLTRDEHTRILPYRVRDLELILSYLCSVMKCDSLYRICFLLLIVGACRADAWVSGGFP